MSTLPKTYLTPEQYMEIERKAEFRSEYYDGEMFAMSGATEPHTLLVGNLFVELRPQVRRAGCRVYQLDMRVRVSATRYTYPDIAVACGERQFLDTHRDTLLNPVLIAEVLSPSTEAYDRGRKFERYQTIESLREYLLVASDHVSTMLYTRQLGGQWLLTTLSRLEDTIDLLSVDARVKLADLYDDVEFIERQSTS